MFNFKNRKKLITILVLLGIFVLYIVLALLFKSPKIEEKPNVPHGEHGQSGDKDNNIETYITISEREVNLQINTIELLHIINNPKISLNSFGEYYVYDGYYVFPKRHIKIKKSFDKILSVVFFKEYTGKILKDVNVTSSNSNIISSLGEPNYNENDTIVYKTKDCYIIFDTKQQQVSAYLRNEVDLTDFWALYEVYLKTNDLKRYISEVTKRYPVYTQYNYDSDGLELIYADLGIRLFFKEFETDNGIYLYSNYKNENEEFSIDKVKTLQGVIYKNYNLILKEEIERLSIEKGKSEFSLPEKIYSDNGIYENINVLQSYLEKVKETEEEKEYKKLDKLSKYTVYFDLSSSRYTFNNVSIISKTNSNNFNINTAKVADNLLLTENYVFFSIKNEGIFRLNVNTGVVIELFIGEGNFELKYIKNNELYYDNMKIKAL